MIHLHSYISKSFKDMITITDLAASRIKELRSKEGLTEEFNIRVAVEGGGCSGLMYNLDFAAAPQANDMIFEDKGVKVMVDKKSILYLNIK
jgi:iron-sulfur cluster assembly protein